MPAAVSAVLSHWSEGPRRRTSFSMSRSTDDVVGTNADGPRNTRALSAPGQAAGKAWEPDLHRA